MKDKNEDIMEKANQVAKIDRRACAILKNSYDILSFFLRQCWWIMAQTEQQTFNWFQNVKRVFR